MTDNKYFEICNCRLNIKLTYIRETIDRLASKYKSIIFILIIGMFILSNLKTYAYSRYYIEHAYEDEFFIINNNKFEAKTYCLGWSEGEIIKFISGSPFGNCTSALIYNETLDDICEVWCE